MSDLISRNDVITVLCFCEETKMMLCGDLRKILEKINEIPSAEPERKWFPVTETLPEEEKNVLVTVHFDGFKNTYTNIPPSDYVGIASQYEGYWSSPSDEYKVSPSRHHVIAWKPLPEPWRGER